MLKSRFRSRSAISGVPQDIRDRHDGSGHPAWETESSAHSPHTRPASYLHADILSHHASIFVLEDVAVIHEGTLRLSPAD